MRPQLPEHWLSNCVHYENNTSHLRLCVRLSICMYKVKCLLCVLQNKNWTMYVIETVAYSSVDQSIFVEVDVLSSFVGFGFVHFFLINSNLEFCLRRLTAGISEAFNCRWPSWISFKWLCVETSNQLKRRFLWTFVEILVLKF